MLSECILWVDEEREEFWQVLTELSFYSEWPCANCLGFIDQLWWSIVQLNPVS
jgi:hypothetical protein